MNDKAKLEQGYRQGVTEFDENCTKFKAL